jgi:hypothetical protein
VGGAFFIDLVGFSQKSAALAYAEMAQNAFSLNDIQPIAVGAFFLAIRGRNQILRPSEKH